MFSNLKLRQAVTSVAQTVQSESEVFGSFTSGRMPSLSVHFISRIVPSIFLKVTSTVSCILSTPRSHSRNVLRSSSVAVEYQVSLKSTTSVMLVICSLKYHICGNNKSILAGLWGHWSVKNLAWID